VSWGFFYAPRVALFPIAGDVLAWRCPVSPLIEEHAMTLREMVETLVSWLGISAALADELCYWARNAGGVVLDNGSAVAGALVMYWRSDDVYVLELE
jgi:hypothetical protein